jgi:predicted alpha/beta hydrolase family esterase
MSNVIILHGTPSKEEYYEPSVPSMSNAHWLPWLQGQLLKKDIPAATPEIPHSYDPRWEVWQKEVLRHDITPETVLVGHSCGAGFFIRLLSENKNIRCAKLILVAPWIDPHKTDAVDFFDFEIDEDITERVGSIILYNSDDDMSSVQDSVKVITDKISGIIYKEFNGYGHFTQRSMKSIEFPELLQEILQ